MMDNYFIPIKPLPGLTTGLVIRLLNQKDNSLLRITHVFKNSIYVMEVGDVISARHAKKPRLIRRTKVSAWLSEKIAELGRIEFPAELISTSTEDKKREESIKILFAQISPLVQYFETEKNLQSRSFKAMIESRANELDISATTLRRLLFRYYYFGRVQQCLFPLRPGPEKRIDNNTSTVRLATQRRHPLNTETPSNESLSNSTITNSHTPRRRGRQAIISKTLGRNEFIVSEVDIQDIRRSVIISARNGRRFLTDAYEDYIADFFSVRHPKVYSAYLNKKIQAPVTSRQFCSYAKRGHYSKAVTNRIRALRSYDKKGQGLWEIGAGAATEIDATQGRIYLIDSEDFSLIGKPWIYIAIDRWSRYVIGIYVTLMAPSWEELKQILLTSFTERVEKFKRLGIRFDEHDWPRGRVSASIYQDRGADFTSSGMQGAGTDLRIDLKTIRPRHPDAKAIIERLNRQVKAAMVKKGIKGVYAERPTDYETKKRAQLAKHAAVLTLVDVYRELVQIVVEHNNKVHEGLVDVNSLTEAHVRPVPKDAYLWSLSNQTGIQVPALSDSDYEMLLMSEGPCSVGNGELIFRKRSYFPDDSAAERFCHQEPRKRKKHRAKYDKLDPTLVYLRTSFGERSRWRMRQADIEAQYGLTLEDQILLHPAQALLKAEAKNDAFVRRLDPKSQRSNKTKSALELNENDMDRRARESSNVKTALSELSTSRPQRQPKPASKRSIDMTSAEQLEEMEREAEVERIRKRRMGVSDAVKRNDQSS